MRRIKLGGLSTLLIVTFMRYVSPIATPLFQWNDLRSWGRRDLSILLKNLLKGEYVPVCPPPPRCGLALYTDVFFSYIFMVYSQCVVFE